MENESTPELPDKNRNCLMRGKSRMDIRKLLGRKKTLTGLSRTCG
jgi:hypothetical protein